MEIKIGVQNASRELSLESDLGADEVRELVTKAIGDGSPLVLDDARGRRVVVPAGALAYVETGSESSRPVGFTV